MRVAETVFAPPGDVLGPENAFAVSDERDLWTRRLLDAERGAWLGGVAEGWKAALEYVHRARHDDFAPIARLMLAMCGNVSPPLAELEALRWELRGERRTRETFGDPHPDDYTGGPQ
jgi:hypothetical protein